MARPNVPIGADETPKPPPEESKGDKFEKRKLDASKENEAIIAEIKLAETKGERDKPEVLAIKEQRLGEISQSLYVREQELATKQQAYETAKASNDDWYNRLLVFNKQIDASQLKLDKKVKEVDAYVISQKNSGDTLYASNVMASNNLIKESQITAETIIADAKLEAEKMIADAKAETALILKEAKTAKTKGEDDLMIRIRSFNHYKNERIAILKGAIDSKTEIVGYIKIIDNASAWLDKQFELLCKSDNTLKDIVNLFGGNAKKEEFQKELCDWTYALENIKVATDKVILPAINDYKDTK
jgi:vacuolar-type H+-ATPase subunit H